MLDTLFGYAAFTVGALVLPGLAWQRVLRVPIDPALVLPIGFASCAGAYWLALVAGWAPLFLVLLAAIVSAGALAGPWRWADRPGWRGALAPAAAVVLFLALTQYRGNRPAEDGAFLLDPFVASDTAFHVGLAYELSAGYPPQVPGVSGLPLGYHLGPDLVRAAAWRFARVRPHDQIARLDVTLGALTLVLVLRAVLHALAAPRLAVAIVPWTLLATDFSFLFAANPQAHWWADLLRGNLLISLALSNPIVPALGMALGALAALARHGRGEGRGWLALASLLALAVPFFKVFLGAHLLLGLGCAYLLRGRPASVLAVMAPAALATAALVLGQGGATVDVRLAPLDLVHATRATLGLSPATGVALLAWSLLWIVASLGIRAVGLPEALRALRAGSAPAAAIAAMGLAAWPLGLAFRVSAPEVLPGQTVVNDAAYLVEQGGALLWILTAVALARWVEAGRPRVVLVLAALLAAPSTLHFVVKKATLPADPVPAASVRAVRAVEAASRPGDVVMQRPGARYPPLPVLLAGRRVPYERFTSYLTQFVPREVLEQRHETVYRFFRTTDAAEARSILEGL
ncbi:MAG TPA: hypothetical protein VFQ51_02955, partial [Vicinamibacteria bacterium]|nr:hypothetical protein [Vicinamibacteria bacterium]